MKTIIALTIAVCSLILSGCCTSPQAKALKQTYSSFDQPSEHVTNNTNDIIEPGGIVFQNCPLDEVFKFYESISSRTVIRGVLPNARISLRNATPLNRIETLQMLDTVLAQNQIAMILSGDKAVKAVSVAQAHMESPPEINLPWRLLPESSSMMSRTVHLKFLRPSEAIMALQPMANLPNSILPIDDGQILLLRDYSTNIRQELRLLEEWELKKSVK